MKDTVARHVARRRAPPLFARRNAALCRDAATGYEIFGLRVQREGDGLLQREARAFVIQVFCFLRWQQVSCDSKTFIQPLLLGG